MNIQKLSTAMAVAQRFLHTAQEAQSQFQEDWLFDSRRFGLTDRSAYTNTSKANAACKRASLDLSMALTDLRKP